MPTSADVTKLLSVNLERVESRIQQACQRAGRNRDEVTLCAITKYVDVETARLLSQLGVNNMGESRPQELWEKASQVPEVRWHMVGHLQRNKVARTLPLAQLIHSVDSERLLLSIEDEAARLNNIQDVLLELHLTKEETKSGFPEDDWAALPGYVKKLQHVRVRGLMGMSAHYGSKEEAERCFARLRLLRDNWQSQFQSPHKLTELSMGMTNDFEQAIQQGATIIRIGSALFEGLTPSQ